MFFSASSVNDAKTLYKVGIREILVSYHYMSKSFAFYDEFIPRIKDEGGLFMTDSGGFSFIRSVTDMSAASKEDYWLPYLEKYVQWLYDHKEVVFVAADLDLEQIVGRDIVDKWGEKYFKPLEKYMNIVYVAHRDMDKKYGDYEGFKRLKQYCSQHKYVGVSQEYKNNAAKVYSLAASYGTRIHGFAWTSYNLLKMYPLFSVDSTSWLSGARYGTTYTYDGKNFNSYDSKWKYLRKAKGQIALKAGVSHEDVMNDKRYPVDEFNLEGWKGFRKEYLKIANLKLKNKNVIHYEH